MDSDIFVPYNRLNRAFHGDIVEVDIFKKKSSKKPEGEIKRILERKKKRFVGIVDLQKTFAFVRPTDIRMYTDIFIPLENIGKAKNGEKVLIEIIEWPDKAESPYGKIIEILGKPGDHHTEIHAILAEYGLPSEFPDEVESYANSLDTSIKQEEILKRKDLRKTLTTFLSSAPHILTASSFKSLDTWLGKRWRNQELFGSSGKSSSEMPHSKHGHSSCHTIFKTRS